MKGPAILWITGLFGIIYIIIHEQIGLDHLKDVFIGNFKIDFIFPTLHEIALAAITSFIIGVVYEYVVKFKEGQDLSNLIARNNDNLIRKIPSVIVNFDSIWTSLDANQARLHLYNIINHITKNTNISNQFVKSIASVEGISNNTWDNLHHNVTISQHDEENNVFALTNTISFSNSIAIKKDESYSIHFVMSSTKVDLSLMSKDNNHASHYWISPVGFTLVKSKLASGDTSCGFVNVELIPTDNKSVISCERFHRNSELEHKYNDKLLIWTLSYTGNVSGEYRFSLIFTISTFTGGDNPHFSVFLEKAVSTLTIQAHSLSPSISISPPKLFLRPDQTPLITSSPSNISVIVNDVLLPGHGVLFLFSKGKA